MTALRRLWTVTGTPVVVLAALLHLVDLRLLIEGGAPAFLYFVFPFSLLLRLVLFGGAAEVILRSFSAGEVRDQLARAWSAILAVALEVIVVAAILTAR